MRKSVSLLAQLFPNVLGSFQIEPWHRLILSKGLESSAYCALEFEKLGISLLHIVQGFGKLGILILFSSGNEISIPSTIILLVSSFVCSRDDVT